MKRIILLILMAGVLAGAGFLMTACQSGPEQAAPALYHCPMHPTYTSDKPGECPICGMDYVLVDPEKPATDGMPGMNSPEGYAPVTLTPERRQLIGIRSEALEVRDLNKRIRTVGIVKYDETRIHHFHVRVSGWVRESFVTFEGEKVKKGQPLFTLYSPELLASEQEYVLAVRSARELGESSLPEVAGSGDAMLRAARERLMLWDLGEEEIARLESTLEPQSTVTYRAPMTGYVHHLNVRHGMYVTPDMELYSFADLAAVWVEAEAYEYEIGLLETGMQAQLSLASRPDRVLTGRVAYVYPFLDPETRTNRVRFEFKNPDLFLKPDMYADVRLDVPLGEVLAIPRDAVLDTGERKIAFVDLGDGRYEPREVQVRQQTEDYFVVDGGVAAGERVVVRANFMVDSESRLKAALSGMASGHQH